jgi:AraC family transcriptional regulator
MDRSPSRRQQWPLTLRVLLESYHRPPPAPQHCHSRRHVSPGKDALTRFLDLRRHAFFYALAPGTHCVFSGSTVPRASRGERCVPLLGLETENRRMSDQVTQTQNLEVAGKQLLEAALCAFDGNGGEARTRIERAVALLCNGTEGTNDVYPCPAKHSQGVRRAVLPAWRVRQLKQHVDANLSATLRIKDVARVLGMSESHFSRSFGHHFGFPFGAYVRCRRIEMAKRLMRTTEAPLCEIALSCGMTDQSHFTRVFRKITGQPPNAWRQSRRDAVKLRALISSSEITETAAGATGK